MADTSVRRSGRDSQRPRRYRDEPSLGDDDNFQEPQGPPRDPVAPPQAQAEDGAENNPDNEPEEDLGADTQPQQQVANADIMRALLDDRSIMMNNQSDIRTAINLFRQALQGQRSNSTSNSSSTTTSPIPAQPPAVPQNRRYFETPLEAGYEKPLDLELNKEDIKLFKMLAAPIMKDKIGLETKQVYNLIKELKERSANSPWTKKDTGILIIRDEHDTIKRTNLLLKYGKLTLKEVRWHVTQYRQPQQPISDENMRKRQDDNALFQALSASIDADAKNEISKSEEDKYTIYQHKSGVLFFKVLIDHMNFDKNEMVNLTRIELNQVAEKLEDMDYDIKEFIAYVEERMARLDAADAPEDAMLPINLFKAFVNTPNEQFNRFMEYEQNRINHPLLKSKRLTAHEIMHLARTKYDILYAEDLWNEKTPTQKALISMQTKVNNIQKNQSKLAKEKEKQANGDKNKNKKKDLKPDREPNSKEKKGEPFFNKNSKKAWYYCCPASGGKPECDKGWVRHDPKKCDPTKFKDKSKKRSRSDRDKDEEIKTLRAQVAAFQDRDRNAGNSDDEQFHP